MIAPAHPRSVALFLGQFEGGLEKSSRIAALSRRAAPAPCGLQSLKTTIAHNTTNHSVIGLLHQGVIVLAIRPATREYHTRRPTIIVHGLVHKHTVVVCIACSAKRESDIAAAGLKGARDRPRCISGSKGFRQQGCFRMLSAVRSARTSRLMQDYSKPISLIVHAGGTVTPSAHILAQ